MQALKKQILQQMLDDIHYKKIKQSIRLLEGIANWMLGIGILILIIFHNNSVLQHGDGSLVGISLLLVSIMFKRIANTQAKNLLNNVLNNP